MSTRPLAPDAPFQGDPWLDSDIADTCVAAAQRWPGVALNADGFAQHLRALGLSREALLAHGPDLYLAAACTARDPAAQKHFEATYLPQVRSYLARVAIPDDLFDEVRQMIRVKLLAEASPRIASYKGAGPLGAWVRVASIRIALDVIESSTRHAARTDSTTDVAERLASTGPEFEVVRERYRDVFQQALERSLAALGDREKALLRFHFVEGLSIDAIGAIYHVHRATAARWLLAAREEVLEALEAELSVQLRTSPSEFRSLLREVRSDLHATISRVLDRT